MNMFDFFSVFCLELGVRVSVLDERQYTGISQQAALNTLANTQPPSVEYLLIDYLRGCRVGFRQNYLMDHGECTMSWCACLS